MFLDQATIEVTGGNGGRGCVSWRREKFVPKGGPNGGDGGNGGNIYLIADSNTDTLSIFASTKKFAAERGQLGLGKDCHGKNGADLYLKVPPGTLVSSESFLITDLTHSGDQILIAHGGRGGYGNAHFKSSTRQRPDFAELGEPGETKTVHLELKLVADVGIIGLPNVGKSTLISVISAAKPKIANYSFTTIIPNLGVVNVHDRSFVVCDLPGLIEGASDGKGLGHEFLRHIERCGLLVHLLDLSHALEEGGKLNIQNLCEEYRTIRKELEKHSPTLAQKQELVVLNKIDLLPEKETLKNVTLKLSKCGIPLFMGISAATTKGTQELAKKLLPLVLDERQNRDLGYEVQDSPDKTQDELPVLKPHLTSHQMGAYRIDQKSDGPIVVSGKRIVQFTKMTDFRSPGGLARFRDVLTRIGLMKTIKHMQKTAKPDLPVFIGDVRVNDYLS